MGASTDATFDENAMYNALQAKYETRAWHGSNTSIAYAIKCIDDGTRRPAQPCSAPLESWCLLLRYATYIAGSFDHELPIGRGKQSLGGAHDPQTDYRRWELAGIVTLRSGLAVHSKYQHEYGEHRRRKASGLT